MQQVFKAVLAHVW